MKDFNPQVYPSYEKMSQAAAEFVWQDMSGYFPKKYVLGLATGSTPVLAYQKLLKIIASNKPDLSRLYLFNLDEYWPISYDDQCSYYHEMLSNIWQPLLDMKLGFKLQNAHIPDGQAENPHKNALDYENLLKRIGYPHLQILGVGMDGHIAFNEKGTSKRSVTHVVKLAASTIKANKKNFKNDLSRMPKQGICMGISSILKAKKILFLANGAHKKPVIKKFLKFTPTTDMACSFLRLHSDTTIMLTQDCYAK